MSLIAVGQIVNVHGIKGVMKVKPYLVNTSDFKGLNPLTDKDGKKHFEATLVGHQKDCWLVAMKGITDRTTAENFKGLELYTEREKLPQTQENEFYHCDLVGMSVYQNKDEFGKVLRVLNYGAGDILQIKTMQGQILELSFSKANFPMVDVKNHQIQIVLPEDIKERLK